MRYRVFEDVHVVGSYAGFTKNISDGKVDHTWSFPARGMDYTDTMLDVVVPGYRRLSAQGIIFNNPMEHLVHSRTGGSGTRTAVSDTQFSQATGNIIPFLADLDGVSHLPSMVNTTGGDALLRAFANIDSTPYSFAEDLAELAESYEYLRKPFQAFAGALLSYRRRRDTLMRKGLNKAQAHSKAWLEYRFALTPMAMSAYNAGDALANWKKRVMPVRMTSRGFANESYVHNDKIIVNYREYYRDIQSKCTTRATVLYERPGGEMSVAHTLGLRAKDIPAAMWAVCPYSWLVDRFVDISALVSACVNLFDPNVQIKLACTSQKIETTSRLAILSDTTPGWATSHACDPEMLKELYYKRTPQPTNQVPLPRVTTASLSSVLKMTDIVALILQRIR